MYELGAYIQYCMNPLVTPLINQTRQSDSYLAPVFHTSITMTIFSFADFVTLVSIPPNWVMLHYLTAVDNCSIMNFLIDIVKSLYVLTLPRQLNNGETHLIFNYYQAILLL